MLKGVHDLFIMVVNLIFRDWEAEHVTIGLFKVIDNGIVMAPNLIVGVIG
jgi:hypothetical protein